MVDQDDLIIIFLPVLLTNINKNDMALMQSMDEFGKV